ncbi:unnamed protein product [Dimorphilus gyrociliatus]|uniref:Uncharacterized protein n=1 Tax=Dimorphilus gyrociliatus TaxID=2664684 RepID=A0A7I8W4M2_9ANNE|nr:unnamed protein product [Dimorphilus gyrociliatus]
MKGVNKSENGKPFEREVNINLSFDKSQLLCEMCGGTWVNRNPRCLPCNALHAFCSECLDSFATSHCLQPGSKFSCLICKTKHFWPENGVQSFVQLEPLINPSNSNFMNMQIPSELDKIAASEGQEIISHDESKEFRRIILDAIERIKEDKKREMDNLENENRKFCLLVENYGCFLKQQLNKFFSNKETQLRNLDGDIKTFEIVKLKTSSFLDRSIKEIKEAILDEMDRILTEKVQFESAIKENSFKFGVNIFSSSELAGLEKVVKQGEEVVSITSTKLNFFLLTKFLAKPNEPCTFSLLRECVESKKVERLLSWRVNEIEAKTFYLTANNHEVFLLSIGPKTHLLKLKALPIGYQLEDVNSLESWTDFVCYESGVFLYRHGLIGKYNNNLTNQWFKRTPLNLQVAEMKYVNGLLFIVDKANSCVFCVNSADGRYEIYNLQLMPTCFNLTSQASNFVYEPYLFMDNQGAYIVNKQEKVIYVYAISQEFDKPDVVHYHKKPDEREILFYIVKHNKALTIKHFLFEE